MTILIRKQGSNGFADEHRALDEIVYILHALVIGLHAGCDIGVIINPFQGAVGEKINFQIVHSPIGELIYEIIDPSLSAGMSRVQSQPAVVGFIASSGGFEQRLAVGVTGALHRRIGGIDRGAEPGKRRQIDARLLSVGVTVIDERLHLGGSEIVPVGIQVDINRAVIVEVTALQIILDEGGRIGRVRVVNPGLNDAPTVPAERDAVGPGQFWNHKCVLVGIRFHCCPPVQPKTDKYSGGNETVTEDRTMGHHIMRVSGRIRAAEHIHLG